MAAPLRRFSEKYLPSPVVAAMSPRLDLRLRAWKFRPFVLAALMLAGLTAPSAAQQAQRQWFEGGPTPLRYELALVPNVEAATFTGDVTITVRADEATPSVSMNALGLNVTRATIDNRQVAVTTDEEAQTLTLTPRQPLRAGEHRIRIQYTGTILDDPYGLFRVEYQDDDGTTRRAITRSSSRAMRAACCRYGISPTAARCLR